MRVCVCVHVRVHVRVEAMDEMRRGKSSTAIWGPQRINKRFPYPRIGQGAVDEAARVELLHRGIEDLERRADEGHVLGQHATALEAQVLELALVIEVGGRAVAGAQVDACVEHFLRHAAAARLCVDHQKPWNEWGKK